jgi:RNA polymerase sigma-70 factor (ECF subfamily)
MNRENHAAGWGETTCLSPARLWKVAFGRDFWTRAEVGHLRDCPRCRQRFVEVVKGRLRPPADPERPMRLETRLSGIETLWSLVGQAHHDSGAAVGVAQRQLLERYGGAVRRYLLGALRDAEAAEELFQEFAYRLLHGDLRGADQRRGRFRDFVKGVLFHLVADYHKKRQRQPRQLAPDHPDPAIECPRAAEQEDAFRASWRDELLARSWAGLAAFDQAHGTHFYAVLRFRADHPDLRSPKLAEQLGQALGKPLTAAGFRKTLDRGRDRFADLLLDEIARALSDPTPEHLEEELIDLGLLEHCRLALERRRQSS